MESSRAKAVLLGHDYRLAGGFLALGAVIGGLFATGTLPLPPNAWILLAGLAIVSALYAYWNDGLAACWLFIYPIAFGVIYYSHANPTTDALSAPFETALVFGVAIAAFVGPLAFVLGAGVRDLARRVGISDRLWPETTVPLRVVLVGPAPRRVLAPLGIGVSGAVLLGGGMALAALPFGQHPPQLLGNPFLLAGGFAFAAGIEWRYQGLLLACAAAFLAVFGLFVGYLIGPEGVREAVEGGLWYALLVTFMAGLPGAIIGTLPRIRSDRPEHPTVAIGTDSE